MIIINRDLSTFKLILTLTEKTSSSSPLYEGVFENVNTKDKVTINLSIDTSVNPQRFNSFNIIPNVSFLNKPIGLWHYTITEKNENEIVEVGNMRLIDNTETITDTGFFEEVKYVGFNG